MSTALYRRYRPESFADVIGQEHVTEPLMQALRTGRVNHAYLFSGPRGCGKTTSARILARCLNCESGPTPEPCGTCDSCVALARGGSGTIDVIEIDAASHGGVDDARDLRERASFAPAQGRYKIYIIDEAHMVTPQGFNALLKIVEEPPEHVKFVFATTEPEKVIGTIRSRTHHYPFRLVPPGRLQAYMEQLCRAEGVDVQPGVLSFVVRAGGGSVRDSLSVLDQLIAGSDEAGLTYDRAASLLGFTDGELLDGCVTAVAAGDAAAVFDAVERVVDTGLDPRRFVEDLLERFRDLIVVAAAPEGAAAILRSLPTDQVDRMRQQAAAFGPASLSRAADVVNAGLTEMTGATSPRLQLELIAARLLLPGAAGEAGHGARLDRIERRLEVGGVPTSAAAPGPVPTRGHADEHTPEPIREPAVEPIREPVPEPAVETVVDDEPGVAAAATSSSGPDPEAATAPAGIDVEALRRSWPDVLGRIYQMRRATWTFLSEHAQITDYDGQRLTLGIATVGLAHAFRNGSHADVVRQALVDALGVDVRVEGVPVDPSESAGSGQAGSGPTTRGSAGVSPSPHRTPTATGRQSGRRRDVVTGPAPDADDSATGDPPAADAGPQADGPAGARRRGAPSSPGGVSRSDAPAWGSAPAGTGSAPAWATAERAAPAPADPPADRSERGGELEQHGISADDPDVVEAGDAGPVVVERLLGGTVVEES